MASIINASTSTGLVTTADTSGVLQLQTGGTTAVSIGTDQSFNFSATGQRITGDFSNATVANRVLFQTSTTNGSTALEAIPNGTSTTSFIGVSSSSSDPANTSVGSILMVGATEFRIQSTARGTGTFLPMTFNTGGSERVRIDTSGNVGIGASSPGSKLHVSGGVRVADTTNSANYITIGSGNESPIGNNSIVSQTGSFVLGTTAASTALQFATVGTERARIDSSGNLLVGKTTTNNDVQGLVLYPDGQMRMTTNGTASNTIIGFFRNSSATLVGSINTTSTATSYVTSSDYRLKENIQPMTGALAKVAALKPVTYTWKSTGEADEGFIAHELQEVCPSAVVGEKDAVDAEGNPQYQGIDTSFLVATLTAAIKEQQAIITSLTDRITALESK